MKKRHILICGEKGVGKTTLIEHLLKNCSLPVYGFYTRCTERDENGFHSVYIHRPTDTVLVRGRANLVGICNGREWTVHPEVFDTLGVKYLEHGKGVIAMDELGFMETESPNFCRKVLSCLDGDEHVIATVKAKYNVAFLNEVRQHSNAQLYEITEDNRDMLYQQLLPIVLGWSNSEGQV